MRSPFKKLVLATSFLSFIFIASCGRNDVCVAGVGNCSVPKEITDKQSKTTQTGENPTSIDPLKAAFISNRITLSQGKQITLAGVGGKEPYTFTLTSEAGTGTVGEKDGVFTAPNKKATAKVKITDDSKTYIEIQIDIP